MTGPEAVPPTHPDAAPVADDSAWPGWIGGFALGIGALTLLGVCCGGLGATLAPWMGRMGGLEIPAPPQAMVAYLVADGFLGIVLAAMLVLGGIATLRRRQSGPRTLRRYAVLRVALAIPFLLGGLWLLGPSAEWNAAMARATNEWKDKQNPPVQVSESDRAAEEPQEPGVLQIAPVALGAAFGLAFPAIVLVVLGAARRRDEVTRWDA